MIAKVKVKIGICGFVCLGWGAFWDWEGEVERGWEVNLPRSQSDLRLSLGFGFELGLVRTHGPAGTRANMSCVTHHNFRCVTVMDPSSLAFNFGSTCVSNPPWPLILLIT